MKHPEDEKDAISQDEEEAREEDGLRKSATRKQQQAGMVKTSFIGLAISQSQGGSKSKKWSGPKCPFT